MKASLKQDSGIVPVMVGTAGHVDHGKTALVRLLTGCNTDTLPEEKARGMSIDLGFAPFILDDSKMVGIVDVPGHEDFIRNMVAGASSIDVLMLIVAADDGIMPQTVEHLKIVSLLRTPKVMAVITKTDLVSGDRRREVKDAARELLDKYGFSKAPIILVSNTTGEGLGEVREAVNRLVGDVVRTAGERAFRMDIERVFSIQGYGTVVAGIPSSGRCAVGDELELFPGKVRSACRAIQKYSKSSDNTEANVCSAINIRTVKASDIRRGMTLALPGAYRQSSQAVVSVRNVHETISIKRRSEMRFCCGTYAGVASCLLIGSSSLAPGEEGFMRIKISEPRVIAACDRFILRSLSPSATVAGGIVLATGGDANNRKKQITAEQLALAREAAEKNDPFLSELIAGSSVIISNSDMPFLTQAVKDGAKKQADEKESGGTIAPLGQGYWLVSGRVQELEEKVKSALSRYHAENKTSRGMPAVQLCSFLGLDTACLDAIKKVFCNSVSIAAHNDHFALKDFKPALSQKQQALRDGIMKELSSSGSSVPARAALQEKYGASASDMQAVMRLLSEEGLIKVLDDHLVSSGSVKECLDKLLELFKKDDIVELRSFRDATKLSRNMAVPMLELFDSMGITRREGSGRRLLRRPAGDLKSTGSRR